MTDQALWALGRGSGVVALAFFTLSIALGITTRSGRPLVWLPRFAVGDVHRFTALFAAVLVAMHVGALLLDPYAQLRLMDVVLPFLGAYKPLWQGLGTLAVDIVIAVVITSLLRHRLGLRAFRLVHWAAYLMWPVAFVHALGNGTDVGHAWFVLFAGVCALTVAAAMVWRVRADYTEYAALRVAARR